MGNIVETRPAHSNGFRPDELPAGDLLGSGVRVGKRQPRSYERFWKKELWAPTLPPDLVAELGFQNLKFRQREVDGKMVLIGHPQGLHEGEPFDSALGTAVTVAHPTAFTGINPSGRIVAVRYNQDGERELERISVSVTDREIKELNEIAEYFGLDYFRSLMNQNFVRRTHDGTAPATSAMTQGNSATLIRAVNFADRARFGSRNLDPDERPHEDALLLGFSIEQAPSKVVIGYRNDPIVVVPRYLT